MPSLLTQLGGPTEPPTELTPTPEQVAIVDAAKNSNDNLLISALAGAAKTSTLVLIAEALPKTSMLCLAFNKRIAVEMQKRLPSTCVAKTLNSVGWSAWARFLNKRFLENAESKTYRLVGEYIEGLYDNDEKKFLYERFSDLMRAVDSGKTSGYIPTGHYHHAKPLMGDEEFFATLDEEPSTAEKELIVAVTLKSLDEAYQGLCDFNDQILCPTVFPASFPQYPLTLVDEAQDLSPLNHMMLSKIVGKKRLIAVGDPCQSIYAFRGADENSMPGLLEAFKMRELKLTVSFRCPIAVVEHARWRAPEMKYPNWAKPGEVRKLHSWGADDLPDSAVVLCRNNAPLFTLGFALLKHGRGIELVGADIGKSLLKVLKSLGTSTTSREDALAALESWKEAKLAKSRTPGKIHDQAACLKIFLDRGPTLDYAITFAEMILKVSGPIKLMTGHKAKGLEFDDVFILDEDLIGQNQQDQNLRYVMQTRAKSTLTYIRMSQSEFADEKEPEIVHEGR